VQDWVIRRMTLEASVPIARKQAEERTAVLDDVLARVRQLLLGEWAKRNQASLEALEAEQARLEELIKQAQLRYQEVDGSRAHLERFDGSDV
jgi:hypothetical protein